MEKIISQEDRIRRAEEIYYKKKQNSNIGRLTVNSNAKKEYKLFKKILIQVIACVGIYLVIYGVQANTDSFSVDSIKYIKSTLGYDIDFQKLIDEGQKYLSFLYNIDKTNSKEDMKDELQEETMSANSQDSTEVQQEDIEGATNTGASEESVQDTSSISQMEEDANYIKENFSLIKPVEGEISSRFGLRNPTTATVPKYHTGIDIAVPEGTKYVAAMDGTVELVSSQGDYGNHVKVVNGDVMTLYAHCKTIYVKEGEKVVQGEPIGETGSTGNVTGPHLHFEIRRNNQYVDPDLILDF